MSVYITGTYVYTRCHATISCDLTLL